ncbi:MAG: hypothetical protein KAJ19_23285 [Gammaproteobacteria bacterium]|nr:hypothetical protein [Gammaproteobacteria bacterium]
MSMKQGTDRTRLRFEGVFDLEGLYSFMRGWFTSRKYIFIEKGYKYKVPSPLGAESEIAWQAWRKIDDQVKYHISIDFHFWDLKQVEVIKDGVKQKLYNARFFIDFQGKVEVDYQNQFEGTPFKKFLGKILYGRILTWKRELGVHWDNLYYSIVDLYSEVRGFLGMST